MRSPDPVPHAERGAVLGAGLVLLLLLTLLGLAGMTAATAGLMMAGNDQRRAQAFDAAEAGITRALRTAVPPVAGALDGPVAAFDAELLPQARLAVRLTPLPCAAPCLPPAGRPRRRRRNPACALLHHHVDRHGAGRARRARTGGLCTHLRGVNRAGALC
ncbi:MAG: PilX N-terminal domain-containing pilus assembly protein [Steroidobacteraceae bacterium]